MFRKLWLALLCAVVGMVAALPLMAAVPVAGEQAPRFTLTSEDGTPVSLQDYAGKWVVLYFYPKDFSTGCTLEAHNFQRDLEKYKQLNAIILGVSVDNPDSHQRFCAKEGLRFKLLADTEHSVAQQYGTLIYTGITKASPGAFVIAPDGRVARVARKTYLIAPDGRIALVFDNVQPAEHSAEVLSALQDLEKK
jgi:thioredoxin-dependent peroxiredoxin